MAKIEIAETAFYRIPLTVASPNARTAKSKRSN
jgi:hypothetical protein